MDALSEINLSLGLDRLREIFAAESDYDLIGSPSKAARYIKAGRCILEGLPVSTTASGGRGGEMVTLDLERTEHAVRRAERWLDAYRQSAAPVRQIVPDSRWRDSY